MGVAADAVGLLAHDQAQLAVRLQVDQAVDDVDAGRFEPGRPGDVVALVEARLELDQHRDLLAGFRRLLEQVDERRVVPDAIERQLDRHDMRVAHRRLEERLDRDERIERMVQHVVAVPHELEDLVDVVAAPDDPRREAADP